ncbi:MAG: long-chain fatty acid transporter [Legionellales bacterium RIFCSPHIGHO2_12_FULL_42_9]|nr:MAG: long-chain fatty acid transporter [Legionellales bacterium RIFCSPHIGHO2_12_FULL_42_9]
MSKPKLTRVSLAVMGVLVSGGAGAGSFSLYTESNGYSIGNFAAGVAAEAYDASTAWYNPAGLSLIHKQQAILGGVGVLPSSTLSGTTAFNTVEPSVPPYQQSFQNLNGAEDGFVPSFYYAKPLSSNAAFGLSVTVPFGLSTNWDAASPLRYAATLSSLQSVDISPEVGWKLNDHVSVGVGPDFQYAKVRFNSVLGAPALLASIDEEPTNWDGASDNEGDSWGFGFHAGIMMMFNENHTRIGLNYQSQVSHTFRGRSELTGPLADPSGAFAPDSIFTSDNLVSNNIQFPDIVTLSGYQDVNDKLAILSSVVFSGWSHFKTIELDNVAGFDAVTNQPELIDFVSTENYRNAWRFALGANYRINDQWMLRVGGGYDQTPTVSSERTVRMPDADRWAISVGGHYQPFSRFMIDAGYTYLQSIDGSSIDNTINPAIEKTIPLGDLNSFSVKASGHAYAHVVGAQVTWLIDKP